MVGALHEKPIFLLLKTVNIDRICTCLDTFKYLTKIACYGKGWLI